VEKQEIEISGSMLESDVPQYFDKRSIWPEKWSVLECVEHWQSKWLSLAQFGSLFLSQAT
jgi:hypothetical protein